MATISPTYLSTPPDRGSGDGAYLTFNVTSITQSVEDNTTTINWNLIAHNNSGSSLSWVTLHGYQVNVSTTAGQTVDLAYATYVSTNYVNNQQVTGGSYTFRNKDDGTLTLTVYLKQLWYWGYSDARWWNSSYVEEAGADMVCSQNPRGSKFDVTITPEYIPNTNNEITLAYTKYASSFTDNLVIDYGGTNTITRSDVTPNSTITFTSAEVEAMLNTVPTDSTAISGTVTVQTYNGSTLIGTDTTSIWWSMADVQSTKPNISGTVTVTEQNQVVSNLTGGTNYISGYSNVLVTFTGTSSGNYSATIEKYVLNGTTDMTTTNTGATLGINGLNFETFTVRAVDSRGFSSYTGISTTESLIRDYTIPVISNTSVEREDGVSETAKLSFNARLWNDDFGDGNNSVTGFYYRVKQSGSNAWSNWFDATSILRNYISGQTVDNLSVSNMPIYSDGSSTGFTLGVGYDIEIYLTDGTSSQVFNSSLSEQVELDDGLILDSYHKTPTGYKYAINGVVDTNLDNGLQVTGKIYLNGNELDLSNIALALHPVGEVYMTTDTSFDPNITWGGTWVQLTSDAYFKIVTNNAGSLDGTSSEHKIPLTSMPPHEHYYGAGSPYRSSDGSVHYSSDATYNPIAVTSSAGGGQPYYPYYYGVIAWHRTA